MIRQMGTALSEYAVILAVVIVGAVVALTLIGSNAALVLESGTISSQDSAKDSS